MEPVFTSINQYVRDSFTAFIRKTYATKPQLIPVFLGHANRPAAERWAAEEIKKGEWKHGVRMDKRRLDLLIKAAATIYCSHVIEKKKRELMSRADLQRHIQAAGELKDTQQFIDDMKKEYESTAITKPMPLKRLEDAPPANSGSQDRLEQGGSDGAAVHTAGADSAGPGPGTDRAASRD